MIVFDNTCIDDDIAAKHFVCDLHKCKGACCTVESEGEQGAPLDEDELAIINEVFDDVKPYLTKEGLEVIAERGKTIKIKDIDYTPTIDAKACAYIHYDDSDIAHCGIEKAYLDGKISYKKPISCHLYPIRIKQFEAEGEVFDMLYYHKWNICAPACELGSKLQVPIYKFLKEPLIRKYGEKWYNDLTAAIDSGDYYVE